MKYLYIAFSHPDSAGIISKQIKIKVESLGETRSIGGATLYNHDRRMTLVTIGLQFINSENASVDQMQLLEGAEEMTEKEFHTLMGIS